MTRKRDIEAAIAAYNATDPEMLMPAAATQLLIAMFPKDDVCRRTMAQLEAETNRRDHVVRRLRLLLLEAGFLSVQESPGRLPNTYHLHIPPVPPLPSRKRP